LTGAGARNDVAQDFTFGSWNTVIVILSTLNTLFGQHTPPHVQT
jgi:hypothetical protein